ncbi:MAG: hypothetical protein U0175_12440 [Caldilineaceae bacterium]
MNDQAQRIDLIRRQIEYIDSRLVPLRQRSNQLSWLRVMIFLAGVAACAAVLWLTNLWLFALTFLLAVGALLFVVYRHNQLDQTILRFETMKQIKQEWVARSRLEWSKIPSALGITAEADHPFAADLDVAGEFSLHRLLDCATSEGGSRRLYDWLVTGLPDVAEIKQRQQIIAEMIPLRHWRERLLLDSRIVSPDGERFVANELLVWLQKEGEGSLRLGLILSIALLLLSGLLGLLVWFGWLSTGWQFSYLAYFALQIYLGRTTSESFTLASTIQDGLERLLATMRHVEGFHYRHSPYLRHFCAPILDEQQRPSRLLRRVRQIVAATGVQSNPVVAFLCNAFFPWNVFFSYRLQALRSDLVQRLPEWLDTWYGLEALNSLATYAWLHPQHRFPSVVANDAPFAFHAVGLGHPLIPGTSQVRNDFAIRHLGDLALITGSNMAGKSTFLRTLGLNLLLAYAGSVVDGAELTTSPLRIFTSIKISDSVTQGVSFFYAEVKRLKRLLDELEQTKSLPLFFCIDEIFRGTNNRERLIGSRSYIRQLVGKHGIGVISTHDLELVKLADELPSIINYHFRDEIVDGAMVFDYKLHPGPCPTTNALKVMRNAGLPVEE